MSLTKGRIERAGRVVFHDADLHVWEEGIPRDWDSARAWERQFKRDVFARIVQCLRRLGWTVGPWSDAKHYKAIANTHRTCRKGDLQGELAMCGRHIEFEMWQDVQNGTNPNGGKYDFDKEDRMTYVQRLEMERTRRRIRDYLCNVFTGYQFEPPKLKRGSGATALQLIEQHYRESWHFKGDLSKYTISDYNNKGADGGRIEHGARVWFADRKGRIVTGTAYYNINNMWWVVTGTYDYTNIADFELYTSEPENPRIKRNARLRRKRLEGELAKAVDNMNFERAALLRDIVFPGGPALFNVWHEEHKLYHRANFCGYTADQAKAGQFTADEVRNWNTAPNRVVPIDSARAKEAA